MIGKIEKKINFASEVEKHFLQEFNFMDEGPIRKTRKIFFLRIFLTIK